jgi:AcrR family transcriptional regulator
LTGRVFGVNVSERSLLNFAMRDGQSTKRKIHEAALRLFVEKGVAETSVRELTQAAGIAEGTLYRHYESKDALVADLFASNYAAFAQRLRDLPPRSAGFRARLDAMVAEIYRFHDENPTLFRFLLLVQHQALPHVPDGDSNPVTVLQSMVVEAAARGEARLDVSDQDGPALATAMILGLILQPATALAYGRIEAPLSRFAGTIAGACWRALNPASSDARISHHA